MHKSLVIPLWLGWLLCGVALLAVVAYAGYRYFYTPYRARVLRKKAIAEVGRDVLFSVILPDGQDGWFHLDALLLTASTLVVLDIRDWDGMIYGSETMLEWTVMHAKGRHTIPNPLNALYDRIAVIRQLVGEGIAVEGRVIFGANASFPKGRPHWVSVLSEMRAEFEPKPTFNEPSDDSLAVRFDEAWGRLKTLASPSPHRII